MTLVAELDIKMNYPYVLREQQPQQLTVQKFDESFFNLNHKLSRIHFKIGAFIAICYQIFKKLILSYQ